MLLSFERSLLQFRATDTQRTRASMKAFVDGLFDVIVLNNNSDIGYTLPERDDTFLLVSVVITRLKYG